VSAYDNDPRVIVWPNAGNFDVTLPHGQIGMVRTCDGPQPFVTETTVPGSRLCWFPTADEAIASLIGEPR
jgi:hypothetical protein